MSGKDAPPDSGRAPERFDGRDDFRLLTEKARDVIWRMDASLNLVYVSPSIKLLLGYEPHELLELEYEDYISAPHARSIRQAAARRLESERARDGDDATRLMRLQYIHRDGHPVWVEVTSSPLRDEHGDFAGIVGVTRDISERKRMEDEVYASRARLQSVLDHSVSLVFLKDEKGRFTMVNDPFCRLFGRPRTELIGCTARDLFPARAAERMEEDDATVLATGRPLTRDERLTVAGEERTFVTTKFPVPDSGGATLVCGMATDITERTRIEKALRRSELKFRTIADFTSDWEFWLTPDGVFEYVSPSCHSLSGYTAPEFYTDAGLFFQLALEADRPALEREMERALAERSPGRLDYRILHSDGSERWMALAHRPITGAAGVYLGVRGSIRDVTEIKAAEALREEVDRITRHDLKNPLLAAIYMPRLLLRADNLTERQREIVASIEDSGKRMLELLNRSLELFRLEDGARFATPSQVDLVCLLDRVEADLTPVSSAKAARVTRCLEGGSDEKDFFVPGDEHLCYSMLANLMRNAFEASPKGGEVRVQLLREGAEAVVRIRNAGAVPRDIRDTFFEKYVTSGKKHGTGLGTYSARLIAQHMGGAIGLETLDGRFTEITVRLPL